MATTWIITITGPDLSRHGMKAAFRRASTVAMLAHRKRFLPGHFKQSAIQKYPAEYKEAAKSRRRLGFQQWLRTRTAAELREWRENQKRKTRRERKTGSTRDPHGVIPLVHRGRLERVVTISGPARVNMSGDLATMRITGLPHYADLNPVGSINKQEAMQAVAPQESRAYGQVLDSEIQTYLDSKR